MSATAPANLHEAVIKGHSIVELHEGNISFPNPRPGTLTGLLGDAWPVTAWYSSATQGE